MKIFNPSKVANIEIIHKSPKFGIPPVVIPTDINSELKSKLQKALFKMHNDSTGREILKKLLIDKFQNGYDHNYNEIRKMRNELNNKLSG